MFGINDKFDIVNGHIGYDFKIYKAKKSNETKIKLLGTGLFENS